MQGGVKLLWNLTERVRGVYGIHPQQLRSTRGEVNSFGQLFVCVFILSVLSLTTGPLCRETVATGSQEIKRKCKVSKSLVNVRMKWYLSHDS